MVYSRIDPEVEVIAEQIATDLFNLGTDPHGREITRIEFKAKINFWDKSYGAEVGMGGLNKDTFAAFLKERLTFYINQSLKENEK